MTKRLVVAVALLALVAACGGGSDSNTGGGTTPAPTSAKSLAADMTAMNMAYQAQQAIMVALGGGAAQVIKTASNEITVTCPNSTYESFTCTATDSSGGTCTVTGSASEATYAFNMAMDCTNFHPDSDTTITGAYEAIVTVNPGAVAMTTKSYGFLKTDDGSDGSQCTIEDNDTSIDNGACTEGGTCTENSADLLATLTFLVGSGGLTITDECGTYSYSAGFNMSTNLCMAQGSTSIIIGFSVSGTQNGESADFSETWTCDYANL